MEIGTNDLYNQLMDLGKEQDTREIDDKYELNNNQYSNNIMLNYHDKCLPKTGHYVGRGKYNLSSEMCEFDKVDFSIR